MDDEKKPPFTSIKGGKIDKPPEPEKKLKMKDRLAVEEFLAGMKDDIKKQTGCDLPIETVKFIDEQLRRLSGGSHLILPALINQFPKLAPYLEYQRKEIYGENYSHVELRLSSNIENIKLRSNFVTSNLEVGHIVSIRGKNYCVCGGGYSRNPDNSRFGTTSLTTIEDYERRTRKPIEKHLLEYPIILDEYILSNDNEI